MHHPIFPALLFTVLAAWTAGAQATESCGGSPCVRQDVEVAPADAGRVVLAVDARDNAGLAIASRSFACGRFAVHVSRDDGATWRRNCMMWGIGDDEAPSDQPALAFVKGEVIAMQPLYWEANGGTLRAARSIRADTDWDGWYRIDGTRHFRGSILNPQAEVDHAGASPHRGTVYVSYTDDAWDEDQGHLSQIRVARSSDGGKKWITAEATAEATGNEQLDFSDLAIDRQGRLFLSYMSCTGPEAECRGQPAELRLVRSTDGGRSWSAPTRFATIRLPAGEAQIDTYLDNDYGTLPGTTAAVSFTPVIAVDATEGPWQNRLYAVMTTYADKRLQVLLTHSDDQGVNWTAPRPVAAGPRAADQFVPSVSVSRQGVVSVTWMDQRKHPQQPGYQPMVAFSTDGGVTFSAPTVLQREAADPTVLKDLRGSVTHAWAGKRLKTAFIGPDAAGEASLRLSTAKP